MTIKRLNSALAIVATCLLCITPAVAKKPDKPGGGGKGGGGEDTPYLVVDLPGIPGGNSLQSVAVAINEPDGTGTVQLAGDSYTGGEFHPAAWSVNVDGSSVTVFDLGLEAGERAGYAHDVNDLGDVVFDRILYDNPDEQEGSAWAIVSGVGPQELPNAGGVNVNVTAISNAGEIIGWIVFDDGTTRSALGALWRLNADGVPGAPINLGNFIPKDISETGIMAGEDTGAGVAAVGMLDENDNPIVTLLGAVPGHSWSRANAISDNGLWVVGRSRSSSENEGFLWSAESGTLVGLGRLAGVDSDALDVNDSGHAVGWSDTSEGKWSQTAVLWKDSQMLDLNSVVDTRPHLQWARCINNAGHIGGHMDFPKPISEQHGFVLIPSKLLP